MDERALVAEAARRATMKFRLYFSTSGIYARSQYSRHLEFFAAGARFKERLFMAANRVGKSEAGAYEATCHLTGLYPDWWEGKRFDHPVEMWACGTTSETVRDIVQSKLFGDPRTIGTTWDGGMVPSHLVGDFSRRTHGLQGSLEQVRVRHVSGGESIVGLKTYEQGRKSFEGTAKHLIWCDEEPPEDCYTEMLFRTPTVGGITFTTFTPLQGRSAVVNGFLEPSDEAREFKYYIQAGWDHIPHLSGDEKRALLATVPAHEMKARTQGEPTLGSGTIYPYAEENFVVPTRAIPSHYRCGYGMDVGWNRTAVIWGAVDANDVVELYDLHYAGQGEPPSHAAAVKARGEWMQGLIDPASMGRSQIDGRILFDMYRDDHGLHLEAADNAVEAGITEVWTRLVTGRLKVQAHLSQWLSEYRQYHRDKNGQVVKANDHLMDATRYLLLSGTQYMRLPPQRKRSSGGGGGGGAQAWLGA